MVWQRRSAAALSEMLNEAAKLGLPMATWQLGIAGTLMGRCIDGDMLARRTAFLRWTDFLGIVGWSATEIHGSTRLYGVTEGFRGCQVSMSADLVGIGPEGLR